MLGGEARLSKGPDGKWHAVETKGLIGRTTGDVVRAPLMLILRYLLPVGVAGWIGLKLWHVHRMNRLERSVHAAARRARGATETEESRGSRRES